MVYRTEIHQADCVSRLSAEFGDLLSQARKGLFIPPDLIQQDTLATLRGKTTYLIYH